MPVDESLPTASVEAGSKHQFVTLYEALYQFYRAAGYLIFDDTVINKKYGLKIKIAQ